MHFRFVRRYVEYFDYDSKEYIISCAKSVNGDVVEMDRMSIALQTNPWRQRLLVEILLLLLF